MSRTYRDDRLKKRTHKRSDCPLCQENLSHKHVRRELPELEFEPDSVLEPDAYDDWSD